MKSTRLETVLAWSRYQPDRRIDFNAFLWTRPAGGVLIDPLPLDADGLAVLREKGGAACILVTNADHWRASGELAAQLGARICAPAAERERLGERAPLVHDWFDDDASLPSALRPHLRLAWIEGGKSPREPVLELVAERALLFADVVRSHVSGKLMLLPDAKLADRARVVAGVRALAGREPAAVLLGDGDPLYTGAAQAFAELLASLR